MSGNKDSSEDEMLMILLIGAVLTGLGFLMWYLFKPQITEGFRWLRVAEMTVSQQIAPEGFGIKYADMNQPLYLDSLKNFMANAPVEQITAQHLAKSADLAQRQLRQPIGILMLILAALIYMWGPHTKFKKRHTLETLIKVQSGPFPYIKPVVDFNPAKLPNRAPGDAVPVKLPLFAEALSPEEWVAFNRIPMPDGKLDEKAVVEAFSTQLGARYQGWQKMAPYKQILLAAFALRGVRKRSQSDEMLGRLSACWTHKSGLSLGKDRKLLSEARSFLRSKAAEPVLKALRQHAWEATAMVRCLDYARSQGGVLSPGQFLWLRGHDRALWYPLNNLGRQAYHPEALGAMSHFKMEKITGRPVPSPKVDTAVAALNNHFSSGQAKPIPPLDYGKGGEHKASKVSKGRKSGIMKPAA